MILLDETTGKKYRVKGFGIPNKGDSFLAVNGKEELVIDDADMDYPDTMDFLILEERLAFILPEKKK